MNKDVRYHASVEAGSFPDFKDTHIVAFQSCDEDQKENLSPELTSKSHRFRRDSMTETPNSVAAITGLPFVPTSLQQSAPVVHHLRHGVPVLDGTQEDDGQISCICGYLDDDGWTVACDSCNRWQHQSCYYPQYEDRSLPDEVEHYCTDCRPRAIDIQGARIRQQLKREEQASLANGIKRQAPKSHKKKVKEHGYTNGWPLDKSRHDRNSASPRDQPPPAKRPKTSHRTSDSVNNLTGKGHRRKPTANSVSHRRSLSESPETPIDLYSEEFMRCYLEDQWRPTNANLHNSIGVTSALSDWLSAPEDAFREMHGHEKPEVLMRWDGDLNDIPGKAQLEIQDLHDERVSDDDDNHPTWKIVTVSETVADRAYIGELKGHVGFQEEYRQDPSNRWSLLRHPEPFVFFHPKLPIYIDARCEGTELRYVRRSCVPNARLQILITDQTDYRFCFMATQQIEPGMEIAVGWDTTNSLPDPVRFAQHGMKARDMEPHKLSPWVSTVLANCGPCACQQPLGQCLMARFDRRAAVISREDEAQSMKLPKAKRKKAGQHISPLDTHFNSRSGSEAQKLDLDDEPTDSRSASGSRGGDSASRDITPNTHYSHTGSTSAMPELSERERKKLAKEEEMFRRQEEEQSGKSGKKKRNSGSAVNTPSATSSSKHFGFGGSSKYADAGTSKQTGLPSGKSVRKSKSSNTLKTPVKTATRVVKRQKPEYVDAEVQCDLEKEEAAKRTPSNSPRRPFLSTTQRLLQRCALNNAKRRGHAAVAEASNGVIEGDEMDVDQPAAQKPSSPQAQSPNVEIREPEPMPMPKGPKDTDMDDAGAGEHTTSPPADLSDKNALPTNVLPSGKPTAPSNPDVPSHLPIDPPAPPWPFQASHLAPDMPAPSLHPHRASNMHLQMPPPPSNPFSGAPDWNLSAGNPTNVTASPASVSGSVPIFSPAVTAAVTPSPARKKLSLSEYSKRNKAKESESRTERESSPASTNSGPVAPPLRPSSSTEARAAEGGSAVEDDVKMEDAGERA